MYKVLFVDDEKNVLEYLPKAMDWESVGVCHMFQALNAADALEIVSREMPDIAIVDVEMPGKDGLEFCRDAREINPTMKFIILLAFDKFNYAKKAIAVGADEYLLKPVDEEELYILIKRITEQLSVMRQNRQKNLNVRTYAIEKAAGDLFRLIMSGKTGTGNLTGEFQVPDAYVNLSIVMQKNLDQGDCRTYLKEIAGEDCMFLNLAEGFYAMLWKRNVRMSMEAEIEKIVCRMERQGYHIWISYVQIKGSESLSEAFIRCFRRMERQFYEDSEKWNMNKQERFGEISIKAPRILEGMNLLSEEGDISVLSKEI